MDLDKLKSLADVNVANKRVLVRADLNVPVKDGVVTDATRLERLLPGLEDLAERGARIVVISHFGRPKDGPDPALSLRPVAAKLGELLGRPIQFVPACTGPVAESAADALGPGEIAVLENLRFDAGEERNDKAFAAKLARCGDLYVDDAFSAAHRAHASTEGLTHLLPSYAGPLMLEEIGALQSVLEKPRRPVAAVIGGAKVSSKIPILKHLLGKVDKLIIGGGMANTFLLSHGVDIGKSLAEPGLVGEAHDVMAAAKHRGCAVVLPEDAVIAREFRTGVTHAVVPTLTVPSDAMILDVGPKTIAHMSNVLAECRTLLWNGPLGAFEIPPFCEGTFALAREAARLTRAGRLVTVAGGGDTVAALNAAGVTQDFSYVSTAGGAFLEWLEGRELPGVAALVRAQTP
jgi:phosphoglycerate kinase